MKTHGMKAALFVFMLSTSNIASASFFYREYGATMTARYSEDGGGAGPQIGGNYGADHFIPETTVYDHLGQPQYEFTGSSAWDITSRDGSPYAYVDTKFRFKGLGTRNEGPVDFLSIASHGTLRIATVSPAEGGVIATSEPRFTLNVAEGETMRVVVSSWYELRGVGYPLVEYVEDFQSGFASRDLSVSRNVGHFSPWLDSLNYRIYVTVTRPTGSTGISWLDFDPMTGVRDVPSAAVPEPGTLETGLLGAVGFVAATVRRKRKTDRAA